MGNQMFQYASVRAIAARRGLGVAIDAHTGFQNDPYKRRYDLGCFPLSASILSQGEKREAVSLRDIARYGIFFAERVAIRRFGQFFVPIDWMVPRGGMVLENRFQSYRYFDGSADLIRKEFQFAAPPASKAEILKLIRESNSISLHVRFQHGVSEDGREIYPAERIRPTHDILRAFYRRALSDVQKTMPDARIFLFSDTSQADLGSALDGFPVTWAKREASDPPWYDMWLMSECRHNIIANSSYSWWAAWLNGHAGKRVYAPAQYLPFESKHQSKNVYPPEWSVL